jgi:uncharacterized membrane protein HdeD (DUF308 family)
MTIDNDANRRSGAEAYAPGWGFFAPNDPMSASLAQNWWAVALRGVAGILFGIIALLLPGLTIASLVLLFAAYMLVDGILALVSAVRAARRHERWGMLIFEGIADLVAGAIALVFPLATVLAFVLLMGAWAIVSGGLMLAATSRLNITHGRWLMVLSGAVSVIWGFLLIIWPLIGALVVTWWLGAYALIFGVTLLILGFRLRHHRNDYIPSGTAAAHP